MPTIQWMSFTTSRLCSTTIIVLPLVDKLMQYVEKLRGVLEMEPGHLEHPSNPPEIFAKSFPVRRERPLLSVRNRPVRAKIALLHFRLKCFT